MATKVKNGGQAKNDAASTQENDAVTIDVMANDGAGKGKQLWSLNQQDSSIYTPPGQPVVLESGATVRFENGKVVYDPGDAFDDLDEGETATDTFTYSIRMGNGAISYATVTVTLHGEDDGVSGVVIIGTSADETWYGSEGDDLIIGGGGQDTIYALGGNDTVELEYGEVWAGEGNDTITASGPNDSSQAVYLHGEAGNDILTANGSGGTSKLYGGDGDDVLNAPTSGDTQYVELHPGNGADTVNLSPTPVDYSLYVFFYTGQLDAGDVVQGVGGPGDLLYLQNTDGSLPYHWRVNLPGGSLANAASVSGVENITVLFGEAGGSFLPAGALTGQIYVSSSAAAGNTTMVDVSGVTGSAYLYFNGGFTNSGVDTIIGTPNADNIFPGPGDDHITPGGGDDAIELTGPFTPPGSDTILVAPGSGHDTVNGFGAGAVVDSTQRDVIDLSAYDFTDLASVLAATDDEDGYVVIHLDGGNSITLYGVEPEQLTTENFIF